MHFLAEMDGQGARCSCGKRTAVCPVWQNRFVCVAGVLRKSGQTLKKMRKLQRKYESRLSLIREVLGLGLSQKDAAGYKVVQRAIFKSIASINQNARYVVDSSNTTSYWGARPFVIDSSVGCDVHFIHLIRHPESVLRSLMRGSNRDLEKGDTRVQRHRVVRGLLGWIRANATGLLMAEWLGRKKYLLMRYEDLILETDATFARLSSFLEVDPDPWRPLVDRKPLKRDWHIFAGNRMRFGDVVLSARLGSEHLPIPYQAMARALCWPFMRRFGY